MTTKHARPETANDSLSSHTVPLLESEIFSVLEEMTPVQQMELIEWLAAESPEERQTAKVPAILQKMMPEQRIKLINLLTAAMPRDEDTSVCLRKVGEIKELNVHEWLKSKE